MFASDLAEGQAFERFALSALGEGWSRNPEDLGTDLLHPDLGSCECKFDRKAHETGNVFLETSYRGEPSGIHKDFSLWMQGSMLGALLLTADDIRWAANFRGHKVRGGDRDDSVGMLVRWTDLEEIAQKRVATEQDMRIMLTPAGNPTLSPFCPMSDAFGSMEFDEAIPVREKREYVLPKTGTHLGILYAVTDCGTVEKDDQKNPGKTYKERNLRLSFELPGQVQEINGEKKPLETHASFVRFELTPEKHVKLNQRSGKSTPTLSGYGAALIGEDDGFTPAQLIGKACSLTLTASKKKDGSDTVDISAVSGLIDGTPVPAMVNEPTTYSVKSHGFVHARFDRLPAWLREQLTKTLEFAAFEKENPSKAAEIRKACAKQ